MLVDLRSPAQETWHKSRPDKLSRIVIFSLYYLAAALYLAEPITSIHYLNQHHQQQPPYSSFINGPSLLNQAGGQQQSEVQQLPSQQLAQAQQPPILATHLDQQQPPLQMPAQQQQQDPQSHREMNGASGPSTSRDSPIFRFHGIALNSTTVKLKWNLVAGSHADYFDIEYGPIPDATHVFSVSKLNGTARDYTFHQLLPDTHYQFELFGYLDDRPFKSQLVAVRTPPANYTPRSQQELINPAIMPFGVKAEAKSNSSIQLAWTEPERPAHFKNSNRVNVIRYYINPSLSGAPAAGPDGLANGSQPAGGSPQYHYLNVTNARESRLIVQKLKPATEYAFAVKTAYYTPDMKKIFTQSGFSMDTLAKTFDLEPSAPRNFSIQALPASRDELLAGKTAGGTIEFTWLPPESPNGQLRGYLILYAQDPQAPEDQWHKIEVNGANINSWSAGNLKPGWHYYFKIRAINQRGQSPDSEVRPYMLPAAAPTDRMINMPAVPAGNLLLMVVISMVLIVFVLFLVVSRLASGCCRNKKSRKGSLNGAQGKKSNAGGGTGQTMSNGVSGLDMSDSTENAKLSAFNHIGSSSTVVGRVGTLARRRPDASSALAKPDFWAAGSMDPAEVKSNGSEKLAPIDMNMAMVSIQRDSPQFATTTQLAPALPDYRFAAGQSPAEQHLLQQLQQQSHYHPGQFTGALGFDQMDNATASALMTLSKRQQQQLQKYQIQFASTGGPPSSLASSGAPQQVPSPHQQPPPPPPLNIEHQHAAQHQPLYGSHQGTMAHTRSLRLHRPTLYDPVSGAFVQAANDAGPPNYNAHNHLLGNGGGQMLQNSANQFNTSSGANTLHFHPHQTSTLLSRRSTNTLRSFQTTTTSAGGTYGQFMGANQFVPPPAPPSSMAAGGLTPPVSGGGGITTMMNQQQQQQPQPQQLLQSHQAVINQLNNSTYPSLPLKHVSTVRPQVMSSLEDQIELELAEKEQQQQEQQQTIKQ